MAYLRELGVDAVWLSPFYPSALADGGYDVDDYRDVDPEIGTLDEFDELVAALHAAGHPAHRRHRPQPHLEPARVVPRGAGRRRRARRRATATSSGAATGPDGELPPSDWTAAFGGPAWEPVGDGSGTCTCSRPEQPDLNWDNREVREDFLDDAAVLGRPRRRRVPGGRGARAGQGPHRAAPPTRRSSTPTTAATAAHPLRDRDEVHEIYREWRRLFDEYDPPRTAVAEAWVAAHRRARYASPEGLGQAFNFDLLAGRLGRGDVPQDHRGEPGAGPRVGRVVDVGVLQPRRGAPRHPLRRCPSGTDLERVAPLAAARPAPGRRARAAPSPCSDPARLALPGSAYLYQGEELGLPEVADLPAERAAGPDVRPRSGGTEKGRDGCRVPLPWAATARRSASAPGSRTCRQPAGFGRLRGRAPGGRRGARP